MRIAVAAFLAVLVACSKKAPEGESGSGSAGSGSAGSGSGSGKVISLDPVVAAQQYDASCVAGSLDACRNLGLLYLEGRGVAKDEVRAAALFAQACNGGVGCNELGIAFRQGRGVAKDPARAAELFGKGCDNGQMIGCANLGLMLRDGDGVPADVAKAGPLLDRACKADIPFACNNAGDLDWSLAQKAPDDAAKKQRVKDMLEHFTQGCNKGDAASCRKVGVAYVEGFGLPKTIGTAAVWFERALKLAGDPIAMRYFGIMKVTGEGTARDVAAGTEMLKRACAAHDEVACRAHANVTAGSAAGSGSATGVPTPK